MLVKVCGMRESENAGRVVQLGVSMMGFIFYDRSPRYVADIAPSTPAGVERVGVFVNAPLEYILQVANKHALSYIQLHGGEGIEMCREIRAAGLKVIKAISVASVADIECAVMYDGAVDYLLFDTKCTGYGGSGERFDWSILDSYLGTTEFLLSGGIDDTMAEEIVAISHPRFVGVDLNSRFEDAPAMKNIEKLRTFIEKLYE